MTTRFFSPEDEQRVVLAIEKAEQNTSGEIKLHIQNKMRFDDPLDEAKYCFKALKLHTTKERNAVLFFFNPAEHKFAVYGDQGINKVVPEGFWDDMVQHMIAQFKQGQFVEAFEWGIAQCGEKLSSYFPHQGHHDKNELGNEVSEH